MESKDWAQYIKATDRLSKPWLLIQWRLKLLQEQRSIPEPKVYAPELAALHQVLINLSDWWQEQENAIFGAGESSLGES